MTFNEAPLSINFKPGKDFDAPLLTLRGNTPEELEQRVNGVAQGSLFGAIVNAQAGFKAAYNVSNILGGVAESAPAPQAAPVQQAPAPAQGGFPDAGAWGGNPGPAAQAPQQQYMAAAAAGAAAGGYTPQPAAAPAQGAASAGAPFIPAFGMPATFRSGMGAKGAWSAYFDPRPKAVTDTIPADHTGKAPSTDDVNHPGLAAGTHKFAKFLR